MNPSDSSTATRAEVCAVACAEAFRDCGEALISAFGVAPAIGARLARATFSPDLMLSDGEAHLVTGVSALGENGTKEGWLPFRRIFDLVWHGQRHAMMMPTQLDAHGNANTSVIGDYDHPAVQLIGVRGLPGNTISHPVSYWVPRHSPRTLTERVDMVSGVGVDAARAVGHAARYHDLRRVVTDLGVFDFGGPGGTLRLVSRHPGVTMGRLREATGFDLGLEGDVPETRLPEPEELRLIREVIDPRGLRDQEVPA